MGSRTTALALIVLLLLPLGLTAMECQVDSPVLPDQHYPQVKFATSHGDFVVELNRRRAPVTVNNFLRYMDAGAYENTIFHRVIADFVVQGGGYHPDLTGVEEGPLIINESGNGLTNRSRSIAMARHDDPHSASSQFFFNMKDNESLDPGRRNWGYTVFGEVIEGWEVVEAISQLPTGFSDALGATDVPTATVVVSKVELITPE